MAGKSYFDFVIKALPDDMTPDELRCLVSDEDWAKDNRAASISALRKCERINWNGYISLYPDLEGCDPISHFVNHGSYEGRKLVSYHPLCLEMNLRIDNQPKVSVIIPNFNNEYYITKCLDNLLNQTLENIEIIIVDDCSTDNSVKIIEQFVLRDDRFKLIQHASNLGTHMARKHGVEAAIGEYIMFIDSDDFYSYDACSIAYNHVKDIYDIGCFNFAFNNLSSETDEVVKGHEAYCNKLRDGVYIKNDILKLIFEENKLTHSLANKIFKTEICKKAFSLTMDIKLTIDDDLYEFLNIFIFARNLIKFNKFLYYYNYGTGITESTENMDAIFNRGEILPYIKTTLEKSNSSRYFEKIKFMLFNNTVTRLRLLPNYEKRAICIDHICKQYGLEYSIVNISNIFFKKWDYVADIIFKLDSITKPLDKNIKNIGIFYHRLSPGGVERVITILSNVLLKNGYNVFIFIEETSNDDLILDDNINIIKISSSTDYAKLKIEKHIKSMALNLKKYKIDLMLYQASYSMALLWDLFLLRMLNISSIVVENGCYNLNLFIKPKGYNYETRLNVLRCADKVLTVSNYTELFLKLHNIDAEYIGNPIEPGHPINIINNNDYILFIARLGDKYKCISHSLEILKIVKNKCPKATIIYVGDFSDTTKYENFIKKANELNLNNNIILTGWTNDPSQYIKQCKLLLSTSYSEGFGMGIAEAQSYGLPCVIYDLPIPLADDNESIISVPQHDIVAAANEIIRLLKDNSELLKLSKIARENCQKFSLQKYGSQFVDIINIFTKMSKYKQYSFNMYKRIINTMTFYADRAYPGE